MLARFANHVSLQSKNRLTASNPQKAWALLIIPPIVTVVAYMFWATITLLQPMQPNSRSYNHYLNSEYAGLQQKLQLTQQALQAAQVRQRKIELDLLELEYLKANRFPENPYSSRKPAVSLHSAKPSLKP